MQTFQIFFVCSGELRICLGIYLKSLQYVTELRGVDSCREICYHKEAYVRRAVLFAASCILASLHPSYVASALTEGNLEISKGLEWVRTWALHVAESDTDRECYTVSKKYENYIHSILFYY